MANEIRKIRQSWPDSKVLCRKEVGSKVFHELLWAAAAEFGIEARDCSVVSSHLCRY